MVARLLGRHKVATVCHENIGLFRPGPDLRAVFFLSAYGNAWGQDDRAKTVKANVADPLSAMAACCAELEDFAFVYASTSSVSLPVQTDYSRSKAAAEKELANLGGGRRRVWLARPYSVTGVGEQPGHLIPTLIRSCLEGEPVDLDPDATHDYVDADDLADGLAMLPDLPGGGVVEFGLGRAVSNAEVRATVELVTGKDANVRLVGRMRPYDVRNWCCESRRAFELGWKPVKTLAQSVREMVEARR